MGSKVPVWNRVMMVQKHSVQGAGAMDQFFSAWRSNDLLDQFIDNGILNPNDIPAGFNIGGLRMPEIALFIAW